MTVIRIIDGYVVTYRFERITKYRLWRSIV
jgi:hypothetical protein